LTRRELREEWDTNTERCTYTLATEHNMISSAASLSPASASSETQSMRCSYVAVMAFPRDSDEMPGVGTCKSVT